MTAKLRSFKLLTQKTLYCMCNNIQVDYVVVFGIEQRDGSLITPRRWYILSIPLEAGRGISAETCRVDDKFPPTTLVLVRTLNLLLYTYHTL